MWAVLACFADVLTAFGRGNVSNATGVDDHEVRSGVQRSGGKACIFKELLNLPALILIDLAAKRCYVKCFQNKI
jgi:hypothetical protein